MLGFRNFFVVLLTISPIYLYADGLSGDLDLSSFSLAGIEVLSLEKRIRALNFRLETLDKAEAVGLFHYRNKVRVISLWASWSLPSRAAMPGIQSLYDELKGQGLVWLAINSGEDRSIVESYVQKYDKYTFPVLLDPKNSVMQQYSAQSLPATLIINKNGYIVALAVGSVDWRNRAVVEGFQKLLAE